MILGGRGPLCLFSRVIKLFLILIVRAPVVQTLDGSIFRISHFPLAKYSFLASESRVDCGEGERRNEFAEWHVVWLAE